MKNNAAQNWCETATELTGVQWNYIKGLQKDFKGLRPGDFQVLVAGNKTLF